MASTTPSGTLGTQVLLALACAAVAAAAPPAPQLWESPSPLTAVERLERGVSPRHPQLLRGMAAGLKVPYDQMLNQPPGVTGLPEGPLSDSETRLVFPIRDDQEQHRGIL